MRHLLLVAAVGLAVAVGCSSGRRSADTGQIVRTGSPPIEIRQGKLTGEPVPLTFAEVAKAGLAKPAGAVLSLYFWCQWGSIPNVVESYDPRVRKALGPLIIADAYDDQRQALLSTMVVIRDTVRTPLGELVTVDGFTKDFPPVRDSFMLDRRDGHWYIVYDTLLARGLGAVVGARASRGLSGQAAVRRAQTAGAAAARDYRNQALRLLHVLSTVARHGQARGSAPR